MRICYVPPVNPYEEIITPDSSTFSEIGSAFSLESPKNSQFKQIVDEYIDSGDITEFVKREKAYYLEETVAAVDEAWLQTPPNGDTVPGETKIKIVGGDQLFGLWDPTVAPLINKRYINSIPLITKEEDIPLFESGLNWSDAFHSIKKNTQYGGMFDKITDDMMKSHQFKILFDYVFPL